MPDDFDSFVDDLLEKGEPQHKRPVEPTRLAGHVRLTTTQTVADHRILESKGIVTGYCALGVGRLRRLKAAASDVLGTRSKAIEEQFRAVERECFRQLRLTAAERQCNWVINVCFKIVELSGEADLICGHATGTAVILSEREMEL